MLAEWFRRWRHRTTARAVILRYHRVADLPADPYGIAVTRARFAEHLAVLAARGTVISLDALARGLASGALPDRAIAITFDDGYRETVTTVAAELRARRLAATVFVVTDHLTDGREFWWDSLERVLLETPELPARLGPEVAGAALETSLGESARLVAPEHRTWTWHEPSCPGPRHRLLVTLHGHLKSASPAERARLLDRLFEWAGADRATPDSRRTATAADLAALRDDPWFGLGGHTRTHPDLSTIGPAERIDEIAGSKEALDTIMGRPTVTFAYPFGRTSGREIVREAGYLVGCGTETGTVGSRTDRFKLPRLAVGNWPGAELDRRLRALGL